MTYDIPKCGRFDFDHLSYHDVYETINRREHLEIKFKLELTTSRDFAPIRTEFHEFNEIPTDFKIHCGDDYYEVHKAVLSKISPVFKVMLKHDFIETSSSNLEITDFDFATVEAVMNLCYGRPFDCISVGLTLDVLYFAAKYLMADIIVDIEPVLVDNISITNFCAVLHYANDCERTALFSKCATFFKNNEDAIKTTGTFLALPDSLVIKLLKTAFKLKTEFDVFHCARQKGICIDVTIDPSTVEIQTLTDFLKVVPYAWKYHTEGLKLKCAQFYRQNKAEIEKSWEYQSYPKPMQQSLNIIGRRLEVRTDFRKYKDIPTDFAIQCGDNQFKVHKDVLSKISPVFEAMLRHNFVETSSHKIEINDFNSKTVKTALKYCYGRPCGDLSTELVLDILYFADKYHIADIFTQLEEVPLHNLSTTNFCAVLCYANDCERTELFAGCVKFYKQNKSNIKKAVAELSVTLVIELMKSAYQLETELDAFLHARTDGIRLDIEELEVPTLADFFKTVPYAWEKYEDSLKMKCAKFWQDNKDAVRKTEKYSSFSRSIKEELDVLGACFEHTNTRAFPGSDIYVWGYTYYPAENASSQETEKNHVRLSLNFTPAVEGRVTVEAGGLPLKKSEFSKCQRFNVFYVHQNDLIAAIDNELRLECVVEIDVDAVFETEQASEIHTGPSLLYQNSFEHFVEVLAKTKPVYKSPPKGTGLRSLELTDKLQTIVSAKSFITFHLYRQMDKIMWYRAPALRHFKHDSNEYRWSVDYVGNEIRKDHVKLFVELYQSEHIVLNGKLIVEADPFPTMTYPFSNFFGGKLTFDHLPYNDVVNVIGDNILHFKCTLEITFIKDFAPEMSSEFLKFKKIQTEFNDYDEIPTDFEIHCGDDHYEVHKAVLSKISPVFEDILTKTSSNKIEITDFDFATVEAVMNLCYGRPFDNINVKLGLDILYFAAKYDMADITKIFEKVILDNLTITNFCAVLNYANKCDRWILFCKCAEFYKSNEDTIKTTGTFLALPGPLVNSLLKCAFKFEKELDVFYHARQKGICLVEDVIDPSTVEIQTLTDFLQVVPYAWKYHTEGLKLKCAQFYQQNKAEVEKTDEYNDYSKTMKQSLNILGGRIEVRTDLREYENIPTDFEIQCGDTRIEVHKDVLSKISPVFEAMLRHNFIETSSNKIEINDFDFKTVEMAMNICYGRPCGKLSTEMVLDILYFADKYNFADVFTQLEEIPMHYLSVTNFCAVLRYASDLEKKTLFGECVAFFNINAEKLRSDVAALPVPLAMKLLKAAYHLETELETFLRARKNRIRLDIEELEVPTLADFFKTVPYAWEKYEDGLKMKCAKFWQENKDIVRTTEEYLSFSRSIKEELDVLGACFE